MYDGQRWAMHAYSLEEQTAIVRDGVRLLEEWTGQPVVAHRAGAYAANADTLRALERNGIHLDSSLFWRHANVRLQGSGFLRNVPSQRGQVVQVPVTAYLRAERPALMGRVVAPISAVRKIDPDWFRDDAEMSTALDSVAAADLPVMVVFLHSFSLLQPRADGASSLAIFGALLDEVERRGLPVATMRDLAANPAAAIRDVADVVPRVESRTGVARYVWRRLKDPDATVIGLGGFSVLAAAALVVAVRRRGGRREGRL
jgi:hypothetical protein